MKLALIGPGKHGQRYLDPRNGGSHVAAVVRRGGDLEAALSGVDGAIVATPPDTHRDLVLSCLRAGKAVLCEKPLALTHDDCEAMLDAAERAGLPLVVAHQHLWADGFAPFLAAPPEAITAISGGPVGHAYSAWLDWGSHDVAMAIAAFGTAPLRTELYLTGTAYRARLTFPGRRRAELLTGSIEHKLRAFVGGGLSYDGTFEPGREPMRLMVDAFASSQNDWRTSYAFSRAVCAALFCSRPAAP